MHTPFVEALGWTLLHSLWQGAVVMLILAGVLSLTRRRSAHLRYGFGIAALLLMLLWSSTTFLSYYQQAEAGMLAPAAQAGSWLVEPTESGWTVMAETASQQSTFWQLAVWQEGLKAFMQQNSSLIAAFWLLGSLLFFFRWAGGWFYLYRLRFSGLQQAPQAWQHKLDQLARKMGILKAVKLAESARVQVPLVMGHFKPLILLPAGMLTGLSPEQVETILIHELAHIRRHDYLINLAQSLLEIIYFYHPAYWWIAARIKDEREHCCDDIAVAVCGNAITYARALTEAQAWQSQTAPRLALAATGRKKHLLSRVKRLLTPEKEESHIAAKVVLSFALLMGVWSFIWVDELAPALQAQQPQVSAIWEAPMPAIAEVPAPELPPALAPFVESWPPRVSVEEAPEIAEMPPAPESSPQLPAYRFAWPGLMAVDTPRHPHVYEFSPLPEMPEMPEMPPLPPELPEHIWENEQQRQLYEESMKLWKEQQQQFLEQQRAWQEEVRRIQQEYVQLFKEHQLQEIDQEQLQEDARRAYEEAMRIQEEALRRQLDMQRLQQDFSREQQQRQLELQQRELERAMREQERALRRRELHGQAELEHNIKRELEAQVRQMERQKRQVEVQRRQMELKAREMERKLRAERERIEAKMRAFEQDLRDELVADGLLDSRDDQLRIRLYDDSMKINGKKISGRKYRKYKKLMEEYGFHLGPGSSFNFSF
ncbi:MAG: hypothetical protein D6730_15620 [Bacteroidetes bacterium]|nr:MAG: hypothetical protein D6730_15620 [Bacteroidota bacterium]